MITLTISSILALVFISAAWSISPALSVLYELMGMSSDKIVDDYPHLRLEQIHDALSYYYEHKSALDRKYKEDQAFLAQLKRQYPSKLRAKLG